MQNILSVHPPLCSGVYSLSITTMKLSSYLSVDALTSNGDAFANLLQNASSYFEVFDRGMDFWIPAKESRLHEVLINYVRLDVAARDYALQHFEWEDSDLNEHWTFFPCGYLLDYCSVIEAEYSEFSEDEFVENLQVFASSPPYDPWGDL